MRGIGSEVLVKEKNRFNRYTAFILIMCIIFTTIIIRLAYLQIFKTQYYKEKASSNRNKIISTTAPRGEIYDRNGEVLATNRQGFGLIFTETDENKADFYKTMEKVFGLLEENGEAISDTFELKVDPFRLETTSKWAELRFKKDRGFDFYKMQEMFKGKKASDLTEEEKQLLDEELFKITPEETFKMLIKEYKLYELIKDEYSKEEWEKMLEDKDALVELLLEKVDNETIRRYMIIKDTMKMQSFQGHRPVVIANDLSIDTSYIVEQSKTELPGVSILKQPIRYYPHGDLGSSVIGYIGKINPEMQEQYELKGYNIHEDYIGKSGIESAFEDVLRGARGEESIEVNKYGTKIKSLGVMPPAPGKNIELTIDWKIQSAAEKAIDETLAKLRELGDKKPSGAQDDVNKINATRGAAVAVDVNTGEILALASRPGFDPNLFTVPGRLTPEENEKYFNPNLDKFGREYIARSGLLNLSSFMGEDISHLSKEEKEKYLMNAMFPEVDGYRQDKYDIYPKPFYNYATQSLVPPGSIFKVLSGIAGLEENIITSGETIYDAGPYNKRYKDFKGASWMYNLYRGSHGSQNLAQAIADSNNYYFFEVADRLFAKGGVENGAGTKEGLDMLAKYAYKFGLGADPSDSSKFSTGIEVNESFGQVYSYDYGKKQHSILYTRSLYELLKKGDASIYVGEYKPIDIIPDSKEAKDIYNIKLSLTEEIKNQMVAEKSVDLKRVTELIQKLIETNPEMKGQYTENDVEIIIAAIASSINDARTEITSGVNLYSAAIGQGMNMFTPLQMVNYVATVANGGHRYELHLVNKIIDSEGNVLLDNEENKKVAEETGVSKETIDAVKYGMLLTTQPGGTASEMSNFPIQNAAKTGSSTFSDYQNDMGRTSYATYVGFAPYDNPEIAVFVILFDGGHGGYTAPVVKAIYEEYFREEIKEINPNYEFKYEELGNHGEQPENDIQDIDKKD